MMAMLFNTPKRKYHRIQSVIIGNAVYNAVITNHIIFSPNITAISFTIQHLKQNVNADTPLWQN